MTEVLATHSDWTDLQDRAVVISKYNLFEVHRPLVKNALISQPEIENSFRVCIFRGESLVFRKDRHCLISSSGKVAELDRKIDYALYDIYADLTGDSRQQPR